MMILLPLLLQVHFWFLVSTLTQRLDVVDIGWGIGFSLIALCNLHTFDARSILLVTLVCAWSARLAIYIFVRSRGKPEDPRYTEIRNAWSGHALLQSYIKIFWFQGCMQIIVALPILAALRNPSLQSLQIFDIIASVIACAGLAIETIADQQKYLFKKNPHNLNAIIMTGLWSRARYPNYFGEILFWFGIACFSLSNVKTMWWAWIGPALLTFLLIKVSGIPLVEKRHSGKAGYAEYKARTRVFWPF